MFTGIIEDLARVERIEREGTNVHYTLRSRISAELKVDQSVAHDGVCLTVVRVADDTHTVTAVEETLRRSNLAQWDTDTLVNLERSMRPDGRLDGHLVQGHVDNTGICLDVEDREGSWYYRFQYRSAPEHLLVDKGSICVNGVSLTVVEPTDEQFSVAIIPYTYEHTNFHRIQVRDTVNLEFDIIGKYIARHLARYS